MTHQRAAHNHDRGSSFGARVHEECCVRGSHEYGAGKRTTGRGHVNREWQQRGGGPDFSLAEFPVKGLMLSAWGVCAGMLPLPGFSD